MISFADIEREVPANVAGVYEIHTRGGVALKVGIASDLRRRLRAHRASRQSGLRMREGGTWASPSDVMSTSSILAKHLFFDRTLTADYDLRTEAGRRAFLADQCYCEFEIQVTREIAATLERVREQSGVFRYVGRAIVR